MIEGTRLPEVIVIEPKIFHDPRGWFAETYSTRNMERLGITAVFVQDNHSYSAKKGTVRALHLQKEPMAQAKLVRCVRGSVLDVAVDIRKDSPNYGKWMSIVLSSENMMQIFIPKGFAHGFITLEDDTEVQYKVDNLYSKEHERSIRYDDEDIGVDWGEGERLLSEKDEAAPPLKDVDHGFTYRA